MKKDGQLYESSAIESFDLGVWIRQLEKVKAGISNDRGSYGATIWQLYYFERCVLRGPALSMAAAFDLWRVPHNKREKSDLKKNKRIEDIYLISNKERNMMFESRSDRDSTENTIWHLTEEVQGKII